MINCSGLNFNNIAENLYLSNYETAANEHFIKNNNINVVINCSKDLQKPSFYDEYGIVFYRIPIDDSMNKSDTITFKKHLDDSINLISHSRKKKMNVLVHCFAGIQRSAALVLCYIMFELRSFLQINYGDYYKSKENHDILKRNVTLDKIILYLKKKRNVVFFRRITFNDMINDYYNSII